MERSEGEGLGTAQDIGPEHLAYTQVASMDESKFLALSTLETQLYTAGINAWKDFLEAQNPKSQYLQLILVCHHSVVGQPLLSGRAGI